MAARTPELLRCVVGTFLLTVRLRRRISHD